MDRIIFCVFLDKDFHLYAKLLHKYFPLEGRAEVTDNAEEEDEKMDQPVPKMQLSLSMPGEWQLSLATDPSSPNDVWADGEERI